MMRIDREIYDLARQLVQIPSINGTRGERAIGEFIETWFRRIPYYQEHPQDLIIQRIPGDPLERRSVLAILRGTKNGVQSREKIPSLLLHGHTDTVGITDYGALADYATKPDALTQLLKSDTGISLPEDARRDLLSGEYCFGRGMSDMKSGDAVFMVMIKRFSTHLQDLEGNLVASFNPVEENAHTGIITSLPALLELKEKQGFDFVAALNNDFTTRLYEDDEKVTLYTGMGGKILPCFYVQGRETHVGQCFEGFDASMAAAEICRILQLSTDHADVDRGEMSCPPSVLKLRDLKSWYNVQTAKEALVYFNYFVLNKSMTKITAELKDVAQQACDAVLERIRANAQIFAGANHLPFVERDFGVRVLTYAELVREAEGHSAFSQEKLADIVSDQQKKGTDIREVPIAMIRYLLSVCGITSPAVVLYYAGPYVPHCTLRYGEGEDAEDTREQRVYEALCESAARAKEESGTDFRILHYYPSLSDSSYIRIDDDDASIANLRENFPAMDELCPTPIDAIRALDIPPLNIGVRGRDAHKWTERVHVPYTFGVLPRLEKDLILRLIG